MPGIAVTAADCAGLQPDTPPLPGWAVCQTTSPVSSLSPESVRQRSNLAGLLCVGSVSNPEFAGYFDWLTTSAP